MQKSAINNLLTLANAQNPTALNLHNLPLCTPENPAIFILRYGEPATFTKAIKAAARLYLLFWVNFHKPPTERLKRLKYVTFDNTLQTATAYNDYNGAPFTVSIDLILKAVAEGFIELKHYN